MTNGPSGTFTVNKLDNHDAGTPVSAPANGTIAVRNYTSVTIGSVNSHSKKWWTDAGSLLVTGIVNDITITGDIDLRGEGWNGPVTVPVRRDGHMDLSGGGTITVNDLNLSNMTYAVFDSGGRSYIEGVLTGTNGAPASGLADIGTALRTPAGETVYYKPEKNPALNGQSFVLASPAGVMGAGGRLKPKPKGTLVRFY